MEFHELAQVERKPYWKGQNLEHEKEDGRLGWLTNGIWSRSHWALCLFSLLRWPHSMDWWVCLPNHKRRAYELDEAFLLLVPKMTLLQQPQERICHLIYTCRSTCLPKTVPIDREADIKHAYLSDVLGFSSSPGTWGIWSNCGESWRVFTIPRKTLGIPPPGLLVVLGPQGPG